MMSDGKENGSLESFFFFHPEDAEGSWLWGTLVVTNSWELNGHSEGAE